MTRAFRLRGVVKHIAPRRGRQFWEQVVAAAEVPGASQREVATRFGVHLSTMRVWLYRVRRERHRAGAPRLLPVAITPSAPTAAVTARLADLALEFAPGTDPAYVAAVLAALRASRC